jgi:hypothetical protein
MEVLVEQNQIAPVRISGFDAGGSSRSHGSYSRPA